MKKKLIEIMRFSYLMSVFPVMQMFGLFVVFCPTREVSTHMGTSPLPVKGAWHSW